MGELWQMATDVMICTDIWRPSVGGYGTWNKTKKWN